MICYYMNNLDRFRMYFEQTNKLIHAINVFGSWHSNIDFFFIIGHMYFFGEFEIIKMYNEIHYQMKSNCLFITNMVNIMRLRNREFVYWLHLETNLKWFETPLFLYKQTRSLIHSSLLCLLFPLHLSQIRSK